MKTPLILFTLLMTLLVASVRAAAPILVFSTGSLSGAAGSNQYFTFTVPEGLQSLTLKPKAYSSRARGDIEVVGMYDRVPTEDDLGVNNPTVLYPPAGTWHLLVHGKTSFSGGGVEIIGVPDPQPYSRYAGGFRGVIGTSNFVTFTLARAGTFTGKIFVSGGGSFALKGKFDANGEARSDSPVPFSLRLASSSSGNDPGTAVISGDVVGNTVSAWHTAYRAGDKAPEAGKYTFLLSPTQTGPELPPGTGFGFVTIAATGGVKSVVKLPNGKALSAGSALQGSASGKHDFILFPPTTAAATGRVVSAVTVEALSDSDLHGTVGWVKGAKKGPYYPAAFETTMNLIGSRYGARARGLIAVDFPARAGNLRISLKGGGLASDIAATATMSALNVVTVSGSNPELVKISVNAAAGSFAGSFIHPVSGKSIRFLGALFQHQGASKAAGYFLGPVTAGSGLGGDIALVPN